MILTKLGALAGKSVEEQIRMVENYLRTSHEELEYILSHLDSSNIIELDITKTKIYKGEDNEL